MTNIDIIKVIIAIITHAKIGIAIIVSVTIDILTTDIVNNYGTHITTIVIVTIVNV